MFSTKLLIHIIYITALFGDFVPAQIKLFKLVSGIQCFLIYGKNLVCSIIFSNDFILYIMLVAGKITSFISFFFSDVTLYSKLG